MAVARQPNSQQPANENAAPPDQATLRRVAIVLSGLPAHISSRLIGNLSADNKHRLREEIRNLSEVDPLERHRAYQAFKGSFSKQQLDSSAGAGRHVSTAGDTFDPTGPRARSSGEPTSQVYRMDQSQSLDPMNDYTTAESLTGDFESSQAVLTRPEMTFLADIDDDVLSRVIEGEHPQAVAFVLASIAPAQAARIVTTLPPKLQSEALNRIARLDEASDEVITDFADHLRRKAERFSARTHLLAGRHAVRAILDAMPARDSAEPVDDASLDRRQPSSSRRQPVAPDEGGLAVDEFMKPRIAPETVPGSGEQPASRNEIPEPNPAPYSVHESASGSPRAFESTDAIHQHLINLAPKALCRVLAEVDTRQALLTLCGLPNDVAEKVLAALPRAQAKQVRAKLGSLGSLQLREIDEAKELVAEVSIGWSSSENTRSTDSPQKSVHPVPMAA